MNDTAFLQQVGHTEAGRAISSVQFDALVSQIESSLKLNDSDRLLDLCCGNGVITSTLSESVASALGVDFSEQLIRVAQQFHGKGNLQFVCQNVLTMDASSETIGAGYSKILMYGALQHFKPKQLPKLFEILDDCASKDAVVMLGFVPQLGKQRELMTSNLQYWRYRLRCLFAQDAIGTWWDKQMIVQQAERFNFVCRFESIPESLKASRYRFNVVLTRK